jgi:lipid-A-disaccharide synthase
MGALRVFIVAGEPSGDRLGGALMAGLRELCPDVEFDGIGGALMQAEGLVSRFPMEELSVMGIAEVLPKYRALKRRIRQTAEQVIDTRPDVMITIDSPDFSLRVARLVKAVSDTHTVHYVAPSVWAWRPKRAVKMAKVIDHVLALLPFEPPYMEAANMACDFVGHPVTGEHQASESEAQEFRAAHGIGDAPLLMVLPGSRKGEVGRLSEVFGAAVDQFLTDHPQMRVVIPTLPHIETLVRAQVAGWACNPLILVPDAAEKHAVFRAADMALAASGTVSLELAAAGTPMVIAYDMNWASRAIIKRMLRVDTVTLVNLVSDSRVVPEFIFENCTSDKIVGGMRDVWADLDVQRGAMVTTMERLGAGGEPAGLRAARAVLARL